MLKYDRSEIRHRKKLNTMQELAKVTGNILATKAHRWELPGNYRDFIAVMVFYLSWFSDKRGKIIP